MIATLRYDDRMTTHTIPARTSVVAFGLPEMPDHATHAPDVIVHEFVTKHDLARGAAEIRAKMAFRDRYGFVPQRVLIAPTPGEIEIAAEDVGRY